MTDPAACAARIRAGAGWFERPDRGLIEVRGSDRVRWSNGMLSNDVAALGADPERSGCYALLLTPQGRIAADLHVLFRDDALWLELSRDAVSDVLGRLERLLIADDVKLVDASGSLERFALEGPRVPEILARAAGGPVKAGADCAVRATLGGVEVTLGAWGESGAPAFQVFAPTEGAAAVREVIAAAGGDALERGDAETLEVLRVEAGTPRLGAELSLDVLPSETGLIGRAVSLSKGCYTGQEIVARMESRGAAAHRLVGVAFEDADAVRSGDVAAGEALLAGDAAIGELTSVCHSALAGPIALAYARRAHAEPGTAVRVGAVSGRIAALPFVGPAA